MTTDLRQEVYIQAFPLSSGKWQVSSNDGDQPRWSRDGKELFFLSGTRLRVAGIRTVSGRIEMDTPRDLDTRHVGRPATRAAAATPTGSLFSYQPSR